MLAFIKYVTGTIQTARKRWANIPLGIRAITSCLTAVSLVTIYLIPKENVLLAYGFFLASLLILSVVIASNRTRK